MTPPILDRRTWLPPLVMAAVFVALAWGAAFAVILYELFKWTAGGMED